MTKAIQLSQFTMYCHNPTIHQQGYFGVSFTVTKALSGILPS